ncbi:MAG: response regulator, partial [Anaerolineales bacterium]|nr:response regulator [Anaerolineales bacterium]
MTNRIMLVEDEIIIALDIQHRLRNLGYQVVGHSVNGGEAVQHAKDLSPELILMDIKISGEMDGIEAAAHIRAFSDIPIIYLTAFADSRTLERARVTGASGYLIKPFNDNELQSVIEMALYKHVMERKLRESEERYALAVRATNDGIWDWDLATNEIYYSPRWKEMLGLAGNEVLTSAEDWFNRVHPEDRKNLQIDLVSHLKGLTPKFESEYRIRHANGEYLWALSRGLALRNGNNLPYRMAGSQSDITARKLAEERLAHTALHDSLTGLPNRVLFMDRLEYRLEQT